MRGNCIQNILYEKDSFKKFSLNKMANHCTDERVEQVKTLIIKPYDLSLIPRTHMVELISKSCLLTLDSHCGMCAYTHTCTPTYQIS